jgi:hypothetical protein
MAIKVKVKVGQVWQDNSTYPTCYKMSSIKNNHVYAILSDALGVLITGNKEVYFSILNEDGTPKFFDQDWHLVMDAEVVAAKVEHVPSAPDVSSYDEMAFFKSVAPWNR